MYINLNIVHIVSVVFLVNIMFLLIPFMDIIKEVITIKEFLY